MTTTGKSEGVPKETPQNNCLAKLECDLRGALTAPDAGSFVKELVAEGYFAKSLLDQKRAIVEKLALLPESMAVMEVLLQSEVDKIRSFAVSLSEYTLAKSPAKQLALLKKAGALPGAWTQETAQSELKKLVHRVGLQAVLPKVESWVRDPKPEVRRIVIEGLRPRGVWCKHIDDLKRDPAPLKPILEQVLDDDSDYVRKAAANNLNDISKDNPETLCKWIAQWQRGQSSPERAWIVKRALRTLVKDGYPAALKLMGYGDADDVQIVWKQTTPSQIRIGDQIPFDFTLKNKGESATKFRLQLEMHGPGKGSKPRVAKYILGEIELVGGESREHSKSVKFEHKNSVPKLPGRYSFFLFKNAEKIGHREAVFPK